MCEVRCEKDGGGVDGIISIHAPRVGSDSENIQFSRKGEYVFW